MADKGEAAMAAAEQNSSGSGDLDVQLARELIERAREQGVSLVGPDGLLAGITRTVLQTALDAEMTEHLGYAKGEPVGGGVGNHRNGSSPKTLQTEVGPVPIEVPRDRKGGFEPQIVPKHSRRIEASTRPSSRCMPKDSRPVRSRRTWLRSTRPTYRGT